MLLGASAPLPPAPFEPAAFALGKPAAIASDGKPTIIVVFASWCTGCIQELPTVLSDYRRFKDRVNFIGVDYLDNAEAGSAMVTKYHIPFRVVTSHENADAPPPAQPGAMPHAIVLHVGALPLSKLSAILPSLATQMPASQVATLTGVANACETLSDASCRAYALAHGVDLGLPSGVSPAASETPAPVAKTSPEDYLLLPHLFVIDAQGIVRADEDGYTVGDDQIARALGKLGIR
jgi:thiol-disulfide isomerase/thioredoxin